MPRKPKPEKPAAEVLAPIPAEILDQIVRDGPLTAEEIETGRGPPRDDAADAHRASAAPASARAWTPPSLRTPRTRPQGLGKPHRPRFPTATRIIVN